MRVDLSDKTLQDGRLVPFDPLVQRHVYWNADIFYAADRNHVAAVGESREQMAVLQ